MIAAIAVAVACGFVCGLATWAGLARRRRVRRRRAEHEAAVRSALYRTLVEPAQSARIVDDLVAADRKLLEAKARVLLPALRGEERETLAQLLESRGATEAARHQCRSRRAAARAEACQLLGDIGSSFAVLDLVPLLDDPRPTVRLAAARALGRLGQPTGVVPLMGAVGGANPLPLGVAADAIAQIGGWPVSLLQARLSDPSQPTRALAVELLGRFEVRESVPPLVRILEGDPSSEMRVRAARALGRMGSPEAVQPLIGCVRAGTTSLRAEAVAALGQLGAVEAIPILKVALLGPSLKLSQAAATALAAINPQGLDVLQDIADDTRHPAGSEARRALAVRWALTAASPP